MYQESHTPTSTACRKIAETLAAAVSLLNEKGNEIEVSMEIATIHRNQCATLACHAGHYLLARALTRNEITGKRQDTSRNPAVLHWFNNPKPLDYGYYKTFESSHSLRHKSGDIAGYHTGAEQIARDLGFSDTPFRTPEENLIRWAEQNPRMWGNQYGCDMFQHPHAFSPPGKRIKKVSIDQIIRHWHGVAERLEQNEPCQHFLDNLAPKATPEDQP